MANNFSWRRGLAEGVVIVLSVFLALAADAWWDGRQAANLESDVLAAVTAEISRNQVLLRDHLAFQDAMLARANRFVSSSPAGLAAYPADSVAPFLEALQRPETFDALTAAASLLTQTPVRSSEGFEVRTLVAEFLTEVEDAREEREEFREASQSVREHLALYAAPLGVTGTVGQMLSELGPSLLGELRSDEDFVRLVIARSTIQTLYLFNLQRVQTKLDSLRAVMAVQPDR